MEPSVLAPAPPPAVDRAQASQTGTPTARRRRRLHWLALALLLGESWLIVASLLPQVTRPLWYDEQWRAYHFSLSGDAFWTELHQANAPLAAGWVALVKLSTGLLGNREVPLRLPGVVAYLAIGVAAYPLARRFLGAPGSLLVAAGIAANGSILEFCLQLKPFGLEVLAAELAFLLWLDADRRGRWGRLAGYAGMGLCAVAGTAAAFVVGPLLLVDAVRSARLLAGGAWRGRVLSRLLPPLLAAGIVIVHLKAFVLTQTQQTKGVYWDAYFLPRGSLGDKLGFTLDRLAGFVPGVLGSRLAAGRREILRSLTFGGPAASMLVPFMLVALALGVVAAARSRPGRALLAVLSLSLAAQLVASSLRLWPFGFTRTNLFMVPFVYLLAGVGLAWPLSALLRSAATRRGAARSWLAAGPAARWAMRRLWLLWLAAPDRLAPLLAPERVRRLAGGDPRRPLAAAALAGLGALTAVNLVSVGQVTVRQLRLLEGPSRTLPFGAELRGLVRTTRLRDTPGDVVVHVGPMTTKGWLYYMSPGYDGYAPAVRPASAIGPGRTITTADPAAVRRFLAGHPRARNVFVVTQHGERGVAISAVFQALRRAGYRALVTRAAAGRSIVVQLARGPALPP
jgi:hypothetical protein